MVLVSFPTLLSVDSDGKLATNLAFWLEFCLTDLSSGGFKPNCSARPMPLAVVYDVPGIPERNGTQSLLWMRLLVIATTIIVEAVACIGQRTNATMMIVMAMIVISIIIIRRGDDGD